jgi:spermidine/putrescine transport system ATP-binding protein
VHAVESVSVSVARGEFFSLLGPSGCGKTTTLRLIAGFDDAEPDGGVIRMLGEVVTGKRPYQRPIGMVFQNYALFPHLTVAGNVAFGLEEHRVPKTAIDARVDRALALVRLDPATFRGRRPAELSGGQRQRVALARALVLEPAILLLDEPLGALDLQLRKEMQLELRELNRTLGITFILVTHDQQEALAMSDRIAVMNGGRVVQIGSPAEIYERPRTEFVARFIGEANLFHGTVRQLELGIATVAGPDGVAWRVPIGPPIAVGDAIQVAVRPEWHELVAHPRAADQRNAFAGAIREIVFLGEQRHVIVTLDHGAEARVAIRRSGAPTDLPHWRVGDRVWVAWRPEDARVLER